MHSRRILFLTTVDVTIASFLLPFMKVLRSLGYTVEAAARETGFRETIEKGGFLFHNLPFSRRPLSFSNFLSFWRLLGLLRERRYILLHTHTPVASFLGRIAAKIARVPLVLYTAHGFHFFRGASWKAWLFWYTAEKIASLFTDALIVLNEEDFEYGKRLGFTPGETLFLVPGVGVDLQRFRNVDASLRRELGIKDDEVVVTCVAEFTPTKNHSFLLAAWREVAKRFGQAHLLLVGDGELWEETKRWVAQASLPRIHFLGRRGDVPAVLSTSDIVVLVSKHEGLPRALLEGMAAGKPLVATDVRGNRDLVEDGVNGFLVPLGDVGALSEALEQLIGSKKLREKMGEESYKKAEAYSLEQILKEMEGIYRKFLERCV